eukprot:6193275-Pleurochrysis_carterae.AAC.1
MTSRQRCRRRRLVPSRDENGEPPEDGAWRPRSESGPYVCSSVGIHKKNRFRFDSGKMNSLPDLKRVSSTLLTVYWRSSSRSSKYMLGPTKYGIPHLVLVSIRAAYPKK